MELRTFHHHLLQVFMLLFLISNCYARFVVEKNSLTVTLPEKIKGTHDSAIGNFGIPQYGGSMAGVVVYPEENQKACKSFDDFGISLKSKPGSLPTFVLVDRGGASAVLAADDIEEALITTDNPEEDSSSAKYIEDITIPSALIEKIFGETLTLMIDFKGAAQMLEKGGYTQFTPYYITWYCPQAFTLSRQCKSQCINHGRYFAPDPEQDFSSGYEGQDVVIENLRQLCVFKVANETNRP
ncbi:hypothetical protein PVK06_000065 [Gossypium arboreum]|uniref:Vacuolar sorting receptor thioredoxin-like domain-containing protein n=1 Tax=Gossypium arboreum TaxID=29729 RepID=A0ABR0QX61_GOSAR|nr:hypothetical protein PVK06_000065 [Gossypium arboreum]